MSALHVPILRGRILARGSREAGRFCHRVMARLQPGEDLLGKRLTLTFYPDAVREVVGVVGDVKLDSLDQTRANAALYFPLDQISASSNGGWTSFPMTLVVRSASSSAGMVSPVANAVHDVDPSMPLRDVLTMDDLVAILFPQQRLQHAAVGAFAGPPRAGGGGNLQVLSYSEAEHKWNPPGWRPAHDELCRVVSRRSQLCLESPSARPARCCWGVFCRASPLGLNRLIPLRLSR